ncbi:hypothetical protein [Kangiella sp. TOML190]|uniref:hypothetical protein n=1 Tax=Kangiella sp. TOML190 TaxID=2931351 RepID=UPI00203F5BFB|nr:hypothetical protein [Kangiella sp. TOML190]
MPTIQALLAGGIESALLLFLQELVVFALIVSEHVALNSKKQVNYGGHYHPSI